MVEEKDLTTKLFKLAGYSNISATFMISSLETDRKMYLTIFIATTRVVGMIDSGSDLTLMQMSMFDKLKFRGLKPIPNMVVKSFSNNDIQIQGGFQCLVKLAPNHPGIPILVHVIPNIPNTPPLLLGNDFLKAGLATIGYEGSVKNPTAFVNFKHPIEFKGQIIYEKPSELFICEGVCDLKPLGQDNIFFTLSPAAPVIRTDNVLITATTIGPVGIIPSKTNIEYSESLGAYVGTGRIINLTKKRQQCLVVGKIEIINSFMSIRLSKGNMVRIRQVLERCPLGREVLPYYADSENEVDVPLHSVNMSMMENSVMLVNDSDYSDIVSAKEPTYDGEADIIPDIIEPSGGGLDIPTIIYGSAAEAINLSVYPEEIRN
jgi:hypothetical protein